MAIYDGYRDGTHPNPLFTTSPPSEYSAFGEKITTMNTPVVQLDFPHLTPPRTLLFNTLSASAARDASTGMMVVSTGTTANSLAVFRSQRAVVYRPGQGNSAKFTAMYENPVADCVLNAGLFTVTDGFTFGYNGTQFGVMHRHGGESEIRNLLITGGSGGSTDATVTVNGVAYTVPLTSGSVQLNAHEIAESLNTQDNQATYSAIDDTVIYASVVAIPLPSSFAFSHATATASWSSVTTGISATNDWTAQEDWNVNKKTGHDFSKLTVFAIDYQYLGAGAIRYFIEDTATGRLEVVHIIGYSGLHSTPSLKNPNLFLAIVADSNGSTTDASVSTGSMASFHQGEEILTGTAESHESLKSISTTLTNVLTIKARNEVGGRVSHGELVLKSVSVATESSKLTEIDIIIGATLGGSPEFNYVSENESMALYDESGTTVTGGRLIKSINLGGVSAGEANLSELNEIVLANETVTIAAKLSGSPAADVEVSLTWTESI